MYSIAQPLGVHRVSSTHLRPGDPRHEIGMKVVKSWADMREKRNKDVSCQADDCSDAQVVQRAGNGEDELPEVALEGVRMIWVPTICVASRRVEHAQEAQGSEMSAMRLIKMVA